MNIAEASIRRKTITLVFAVLMVVLGIWSYIHLPRLEDPEFTIKDALIITPYPGASAQEVEKEVSDVVERAVQQLEQLDRVLSRSERGRSTITVTIRDQYDRHTLPQVWDELRRKVSDAQRQLPPGAGPSLVLDDFGDVFGIFYALTGPDFSDAELYETAKLLRRELLLVPDVKKIEIFGHQQEIIYIELARDRIARLGIRPEAIFAALREQNLVVQSGAVDVGPLTLTINPTGEWTGVHDFENLLIRGGDGGELVRLSDIANVRRDYIDPPTTSLRYDGERAVGIGISTVGGGNVVTMGAAVERRIRELGSQIPLGMQLHKISFQADTVTEAINEFILNLGMSIVIVFVVLLLAMGIRSGLIIGAILFITMCGTMIVMAQTGLILERISLGALVIALVMLVDNAIVITEGMLVAMQRGHDKLRAAKDVVSQTAIPLLGSTAIAVLAFGAIGLSDDKTGEYCRSLFVVLLISLGLSWITAITITPLFGYFFLKSAPSDDNSKAKDPYAGPIYQGYKKILLACMRARGLTIGVLIAMLALSIFGFRFVRNSFFPESTRAQFMVDVWLSGGTRLDQTDRVTQEMRKVIAEIPGITHITTSVGQGTLRFLLTYSPERFDPSYAQFLIDVKEQALINEILPRVQKELTEKYPDAQIIAKRFLLGPGEGGRIQVRFSGEDYNTLRSLAAQTMEILRADGGAKGIRIDSREPVATLRPQFSEAQARVTGITRTDLGRTLEAAFSGQRIGVYREGDELLPIMTRGPEAERADPDLIQDVQIFSPVANRFLPLRQIISGFTTEWEDPIHMRRNRLPTITVHADQTAGLASTLLNRVREQIEAIPLPDGYRMEWGGEYEDSSKAKAALAGTLPAFLLMMVLIVICLFNSLRITLIIWLTVPLSIIGIVIGLLIFNQPFGFMALLGALSLSGMLIKNGIVLIDEINSQLASGKAAWTAVVDASVSRVRPVSMAVLTTVFGLIPLLFDVFFGAMAVTIVVGLLFASALTLFVVPVLYATFFKVRPEKESISQYAEADAPSRA
ncbi:MAG TPA: efflux RND transporter permease subunit [Terrimicrobiaceae bacterium]|nr:efflux RND transporter permease subunit [Terrimicrobiaceae bacterium]